MKAASVFMCLAAFAVFTISLVFLGTYAPAKATGEWSYQDFVTLMLTVVTVVLAALGLGIAALAIIGYRDFVARTEQVATATAGRIARRLLKEHIDSDEFKSFVNDRVAELEKERIAAGIKPKATGEQPPTPPPTETFKQAPRGQ